VVRVENVACAVPVIVPTAGALLTKVAGPLSKTLPDVGKFPVVGTVVAPVYAIAFPAAAAIVSVPGHVLFGETPLHVPTV
jgi:hypothetical protein